MPFVLPKYDASIWVDEFPVSYEEAITHTRFLVRGKLAAGPLEPELLTRERVVRAATQYVSLALTGLTLAAYEGDTYFLIGFHYQQSPSSHPYPSGLLVDKGTGHVFSWSLGNEYPSRYQWLEAFPYPEEEILAHILPYRDCRVEPIPLQGRNRDRLFQHLLASLPSPTGIWRLLLHETPGYFVVCIGTLDHPYPDQLQQGMLVDKKDGSISFWNRNIKPTPGPAISLRWGCTSPEEASLPPLPVHWLDNFPISIETVTAHLDKRGGAFGLQAVPLSDLTKQKVVEHLFGQPSFTLLGYEGDDHFAIALPTYLTLPHQMFQVGLLIRKSDGEAAYWNLAQSPKEPSLPKLLSSELPIQPVPDPQSAEQGVYYYDRSEGVSSVRRVTTFPVPETELIAHADNPDCHGYAPMPADATDISRVMDYVFREISYPRNVINFLVHENTDRFVICVTGKNTPPEDVFKRGLLIRKSDGTITRWDLTREPCLEYAPTILGGPYYDESAGPQFSSPTP